MERRVGQRRPSMAGLTLSRRQLENKMGKILRKWRFQTLPPPYATLPKTHLLSSQGHKNTHTLSQTCF